MVMFYAKWCGACKAARPELEDMAKEAAEKIPKVLFKRYDAENNASKFDI